MALMASHGIRESNAFKTRTGMAFFEHTVPANGNGSFFQLSTYNYYAEYSRS
jgi:hypothetical protein